RREICRRRLASRSPRESSFRCDTGGQKGGRNRTSGFGVSRGDAVGFSLRPRTGTACDPGDQHPAWHDAHFARARAGGAFRHGFRRAGAVDPGGRVVAAVKARRSGRARGRASAPPAATPKLAYMKLEGARRVAESFEALKSPRKVGLMFASAILMT